MVLVLIVHSLLMFHNPSALIFLCHYRAQHFLSYFMGTFDINRSTALCP
jgi:hypothetical protein